MACDGIQASTPPPSRQGLTTLLTEIQETNENCNESSGNIKQNISGEVERRYKRSAVYPVPGTRFKLKIYTWADQLIPGLIFCE